MKLSRVLNHPGLRPIVLPFVHFLEVLLSPFTSQDSFAKRVNSYFDSEATRMGVENHLHHNANPYLKTLGYGPIMLDPHRFKGTLALDFGCGGGRNLINIANLKIFEQVDGCDISEKNLEMASRNANSAGISKSNFIKTDGLSAKLEKKYKFIFSTIVIQHIPSRKIRNQILADLLNALETGGLLVFQMGYGGGVRKKKNSISYRRNVLSALETNGRRDVRVTDPSQVLKDLHALGARNIEYFITPAFADSHPQWIWFHVSK